MLQSRDGDAVGADEELFGDAGVEEAFRIRFVQSFVDSRIGGAVVVVRQRFHQLDEELGRRVPQLGRSRDEDVGVKLKEVDDLIGTSDQDV